MIVADSSVWIAYFNTTDGLETSALDTYLDHGIILCGDLILAEILQGFRSDTDFETARSLLLALDIVEFGGKDLALQAAANYRQLRKSGITIRRTIDLIIGTWCISNDAVLLHMDRDFDHMQKLGLKVWRPH